MDGHRDRGINMQGAASFNNKLVTKLSCAPADIMVFLEACAMGNIDRVNELIEKGVDVNTTGRIHPDVTGIPNLLVIKACQSLTSRGLVKQQFAWRHYYWTLTNEGIEYLREYLHLPPEIVPMTMKKQA